MATIEDNTSVKGKFVEDIKQLTTQLTQQKQCWFFGCRTHTPKKEWYCTYHFGKKKCERLRCKEIIANSLRFCGVHTEHIHGCTNCTNVVTEGGIYCNDCLVDGSDIRW
uniref:Uncharacterized protein n=1 Tax=viral metagenome TaxID=1070528 RepID=A0A6C0I010_9ZZZZ